MNFPQVSIQLPHKQGFLSDRTHYDGPSLDATTTNMNATLLQCTMLAGCVIAQQLTGFGLSGSVPITTPFGCHESHMCPDLSSSNACLCMCK